MRLSIGRKILVGFGLALLLLLSLSGMSYVSVVALIDDTAAVSRTHERLQRLESILALVRAAESGVHGFVLTGDDGYLQPYHQGIGQVPRRLADLELLLDDETQQQRLRAVAQAIAPKLSIMAETVEAYHRLGSAAAQRIVRTDRGRDLMVKIRRQIDTMRAHEEIRLTQRSQEVTGRARLTTFLIPMGSLLGVALVGIALVVIDRDIVRRQQAEAALREQRTRLRQIFDSTSDGILFVSREGRLEAANRKAAELLGTGARTPSELELRSVMAELERAAFGPLRADPRRERRGDLDLGGGTHVVSWTAQSTTDTAGRAVGFTLTLRDVTEERAVDRMKSDFVSFVTHQLRTPLAGIKWMLELAADAASAADDKRSYIGDARESANRLITLVNDLLDVARLESGRLTIDPVPTDAGALTRSVLDEMRPLVQDKGHRLVVELDAHTGCAMVDPQLLRQALLNLVSNAVKYTPPRGTITVEAQRADGQVRWSVRDTGIGVPAGAHARLFEKFYRADNVLALETEGTGLGLYLVRLIVERSGGRVWCESEEGRGTAFFVTLPAAEGEEA